MYMLTRSVANLALCAGLVGTAGRLLVPNLVLLVGEI